VHIMEYHHGSTWLACQGNGHELDSWFCFLVCHYSVLAIVRGAHSLSWPRTMAPPSPPPPPMWFWRGYQYCTLSYSHICLNVYIVLLRRNVAGSALNNYEKKIQGFWEIIKVYFILNKWKVHLNNFLVVMLKSRSKSFAPNCWTCLLICYT
jgi:hypothetical protein